MKRLLFSLLILIPMISYSQKPDNLKAESWKKMYRATPTKINDLVHTKLDVRFDLTRSWMYGKAWITLKPHFYPTDSLRLDAKSMKINGVSVLKEDRYVPLKYSYDSLNLKITLDRTYNDGEYYTIFIDYVSMPNEVRVKGSAAIMGAKGLYFINPLGDEKDKPTEIWTQGETESNSAWVPTIDKPNQKTTDEISMTVPARFLTLSNGLLIKQKKHSDGTRTDTWKMDLPQAPYLMMMAVGEYSVIKDRYEKKEVSYFVEKEYVPVARKIFGYTPEMIKFYSDYTGVDFPWQKYSQVVVRDYVSGAMENTTATVHAESAQQDARQLIDGNSWEDVISHELFHSWFGDYVTTESWSNIAINESFADFAELLWEEYKHGQDAAGELNYTSIMNYLYSNSSKKDLVRFYYRNREELFDVVSYQKGGRILNMLRNYVGDSAFRKSINLFLTTHRFKSAEVQELRLAFEAVTGQDLNWFWNQWFYGSGHPKLDISYDYIQPAHTVKVFVKQTQPDKVFRLPLAIDVYQGGARKRYKVWIENKADTFSFQADTRPDLVNFDGDKRLLCEKTDHKTIDNYIYQYKNAGLYLDRREAIDYAANNQTRDPKSFELLKTATGDRFTGLRVLAIQRLNVRDDSIRKVVEPILKNLAENDPSSHVRAGAVQSLGKLKNPEFKALFLKAVDDSSYSVAGSALLALGQIDSAAAYRKARSFSSLHVRGELNSAVINTLYSFAGENEFDSLAAKFDELPLGNNKFMILQPFSGYLKKVKDTEKFKKGIDIIVKFRDSIPEAFSDQVLPYLNGMILGGIASAKQAAGLSEQAQYVKSKIGNYKMPSMSEQGVEF
ncbi:MAG: M1 family metallopeptidase [Bacteroidota bacterium]|nr:M1 family metallopeptidase [Bacteroidota bacterium]